MFTKIAAGALATTGIGLVTAGTLADIMETEALASLRALIPIGWLILLTTLLKLPSQSYARLAEEILAWSRGLRERVFGKPDPVRDLARKAGVDVREKEGADGR